MSPDANRAEKVTVRMGARRLQTGQAGQNPGGAWNTGMQGAWLLKMRWGVRLRQVAEGFRGLAGARVGVRTGASSFPVCETSSKVPDLQRE